MPFQEQEPIFHDLRYGLSVREVLREIDSPFFDRPQQPELPPLDPNDRVFYDQFLRAHFQEEQEVESTGLELYSSFTRWKCQALNATLGSSQAAHELRKIYTRMNVSGLFRHVSLEVDKVLYEPEHEHTTLGGIDFILLEGIACDAAELEKEIERQREVRNTTIIIINSLDDDRTRQQGGY